MFRVLGWLIVFSFAVLSISSVRNVNLYDEGIILTGAQRVLDGAVIHRDFYANYGPGQFYLLALFFKVFNQSVLVERFADVLVKSLIICMIDLVALSYMDRISARVISITSLFWIASMGAPSYPIWACLLLILCLIKNVIPILEGDDCKVRQVVAGILAGFIVLFRYDVGVLVFIAVVPVLVCQKFFLDGPLPSRLWQVSRSLSLVTLGLCTICVPLATAYLCFGSVADFVQQFYQIPSSFYVRTRSLPFPRFDGRSVLNRELVVYLPQFAALLGAVSLALFKGHGAAADMWASGVYQADLRRNHAAVALLRGWGWKMLLLTDLAFFLLFKGVVRVSSLHMALALVPSFLILGAIIFRMTMEPERSQKLWILQLGLLSALLLTGATSLLAAGRTLAESRTAILEIIDTRILMQVQANDNSLGFGGACASKNTDVRARCFFLPDGAQQAIDYITRNTRPDEHIFVGTGRHDKIFVNDVAFYFLANRAPGTKWYHYDPGVQTSYEVQARMVDDLIRAEVRYVVISRMFDQQVEPNESSKSSGVVLLDQHIETHYQRVETFGFYTVLAKRSSARPAG